MIQIYREWCQSQVVMCIILILETAFSFLYKCIIHIWCPVPTSCRTYPVPDILYQTASNNTGNTLATTAVPFKQLSSSNIITSSLNFIESGGNSIALKWQWPHQQLLAGSDNNSFCNQWRRCQHQNSAVNGCRNKSSGGIGPSNSNNSNTVSGAIGWNNKKKFQITIHWQWQKQEQWSVGKTQWMEMTTTMANEWHQRAVKKVAKATGFDRSSHGIWTHSQR